MDFIHLHNHSEASIADGLFNPSKWVKAIKELGFKGHALTDHGTMMNLIPFYHQMKGEGLVPILGCEFYYVDDPTEKTASNRKAQHIILLAKNYDGFLNLLELSKLSYTEGFYYRPRIGLEWITRYSEGLICSTACLGGILAHEYWREKDGDESIGLLKKFEIFKNIFKDDFYVEFQGHNQEDQIEVNNYFYKNLKDYKPLVTNDCHYILPEHARIQQLLKDNAYKSKNSDAGQSYTSCDSLWLKNEKQILETFKEHHKLPLALVQSGMENTLDVFEKCKDFELPKVKHYLPVFREKIDSKELFLKLIKNSLNKLVKGKSNAKEYKKRFIKEYKVISKYGLEDYFLIVWDLVRFAKKQGIYTGIGRGSAAGCLISYLLGIVKLDPLEYDLIFERFLNENRCESGELPDIDLDVESLRRDEIKQYILNTYGRDKVCEIGTYGRMKLKTSLIDFGKALNVANHHQLLSITTKIETDSLEEAVDDSPELKRLLLKDEYYCFAVEEIYGQIKSQSVHPAGMIIASKPVHEITPVKTQKDKSGERIVTTQSEDKVCIGQGLMKMDILGLKEYDIIKKIIQDSGCDLSVDNYIDKIISKEKMGLNKDVWRFFQKGWTEGVFQFSSTGMQELLKNIVPDRMNDLIAANALYRPGCLRNGWHNDYCNRKHKKEDVEYIHPIVKEVTKDTYAIYVYQEQVMEIINKLGGVSLVESDNIRSALGKKNEDKLKKYGPMFVEGASKYIDKIEAEKLWGQLMKSSEYSFNKSHSAAYSLLAYISQYLKVNYPVYFWCAHLEWDVKKNKQEDMVIHKKAAQKMKIHFLPPRINKSRAVMKVEHTAVGKKIRWSYSSIKGIGEKTAKEIQLKEYTDLENFYVSVNKSRVRFNNMVSMAYAGVFDEWGDRKDVIEWLHNKKGTECPELDDLTLMMKFRESMGFFEQKIKEVKVGFAPCQTEEELRSLESGSLVRVGGLLESCRVVNTKNGDKMAFGVLVDQDEEIALTIFPEAYKKFKNEIKKNNFVEIEGIKSNFNNIENQVEVQKLYDPTPTF